MRKIVHLENPDAVLGSQKGKVMAKKKERNEAGSHEGFTNPENKERQQDRKQGSANA